MQDYIYIIMIVFSGLFCKYFYYFLYVDTNHKPCKQEG